MEFRLRLDLTHRDDPGAYAFETAAQGQRLARNQLQALSVRQQHSSAAGTLRSAAPGSTQWPEQSRPLRPTAIRRFMEEQGPHLPLGAGLAPPNTMPGLWQRWRKLLPWSP